MGILTNNALASKFLGLQGAHKAGMFPPIYPGRREDIRKRGPLMPMEFICTLCNIAKVSGTDIMCCCTYGVCASCKKRRDEEESRAGKQPGFYRQERDELLWWAKSAPEKQRRSSGPINQSDYVAVYSQPVNLPTVLYGPCLIWKRGLSNDGYGRISTGGKTRRAHRVAYEMTRGSIPKNKNVLHLCNRRSCVQPSHLYAGTHRDNRGDWKLRTDRDFAWALVFGRHSEIGQECRRYMWGPPELIQMSYGLTRPEHKCSYTIPVGDGEGLCEICFDPRPGTSLFRAFGARDHQKEEEEARRMANGETVF